jgi:hypothetical protein
MSRNYKPERQPTTTRRKPKAARINERAARAAGRKLLLFAGAAIAIVLLSVWLMMR